LEIKPILKLLEILEIPEYYYFNSLLFVTQLGSQRREHIVTDGTSELALASVDLGTVLLQKSLLGVGFRALRAWKELLHLPAILVSVQVLIVDVLVVEQLPTLVADKEVSATFGGPFQLLLLDIRLVRRFCGRHHRCLGIVIRWKFVHIFSILYHFLIDQELLVVLRFQLIRIDQLLIQRLGTFIYVNYARVLAFIPDVQQILLREDAALAELGGQVQLGKAALADELRETLVPCQLMEAKW